MSPKKIFLACLALFAVLSAATLAYYLPKLRGGAASTKANSVPPGKPDSQDQTLMR